MKSKIKKKNQAHEELLEIMPIKRYEDLFSSIVILSFYFYKECFKTRELMITKHHVCCKCFYLFENPQQTICPTPGCGKTRYVEGSNEPEAFFITMDAQQQIQDFFTGKLPLNQRFAG